MPKVSIILPTYNGAKWIKNAMQSVLNQSFVDWELLVVNDGSIDNTDEVISSFTDERIKYIKNEQNLGLQKTLNKGINLAKGEYVARLDDDDQWIDLHKLEKQIEYLEQNKKCVLVGTGVIVVDENGKEILRYLNKKTDKKIRASILFKNNFVHSSVVFRKDKVLEVGLYGEGEESHHIEDYDLWLRLGLVGEFYNLPIYGVLYMTRNSGISLKNRKEQFLKSLNLIKKYKNKYPNFYAYFVLAFLRNSLYFIYLKIPKKIQKVILYFYKNLI
jgi:glycosyltransferase involved in cell wall biosynthesis